MNQDRAVDRSEIRDRVEHFLHPLGAPDHALEFGALLETMRCRGPEGHPLSAAAVTLFGSVYAGLSLAFVPLLHALPSERVWGAGAGDPWVGLMVVALPLAATWVGDSAAYFAGSAWGKKKLAPTISPNKSWVGFWAAVGGAGVAAGIWFEVVQARLPGIAPAGLIVFTFGGAVLGVSAVVADLLESLLKREAGVKDSGGFFPGHGGVLDRFDSLLFTIPTSYLLLVILAGLA